MTSLRELQRDFMRAILDDPASAAAVPVVPNGLHAAQRLQVYAGNAHANFSSALELSYPVVRRLVGAAYFAQCARSFQREHPSRSGDLQPAGAPFPAYIDALHRGGEYRYLGDVARFEWLLQEALLAADHPPLDLGKLAAVATGDYDSLRFRLHPSVRLFESDYPCLAIWQANSAAEEPPVIDLHGAPRERIAIMRSGSTGWGAPHVHGTGLGAPTAPRFHALSEGEQAFLAALQAAAPFAAAVEAGTAAAAAAAARAAPAEADAVGAAPASAAAAGAAPGFNAGDALRRFVLAAAIVDFD